jgi:DNA ligase-associated metallophosphoesterase
VNAALRHSDYAFAASPCGAVRMHVAETQVHLRPSGALWLEGARTLVVADLHLEKGSSFAMRGQMLPPYDTAETLGRLEAEIIALEPLRLIFLGDSFHDGLAVARLPARDAAKLVAIAAMLELVWIVGNHDADGPGGLPGIVAEEMRIEGLLLRHEPRAGGPAGETAGHLHPCARIAGTGRSVRRRCFATDGLRLILPAFGAYAGGLNLRDVAFAGMFMRPPLAVALGPQRAHAIGWGSLRGD